MNSFAIRKCTKFNINKITEFNRGPTSNNPVGKITPTNEIVTLNNQKYKNLIANSIKTKIMKS